MKCSGFFFSINNNKEKYFTWLGFDMNILHKTSKCTYKLFVAD